MLDEENLLDKKSLLAKKKSAPAVLFFFVSTNPEWAFDGDTPPDSEMAVKQLHSTHTQKKNKEDQGPCPTLSFFSVCGWSGMAVTLISSIFLRKKQNNNLLDKR